MEDEMSSEENEIRIVVFSGSVRPGNYTAKATALVVDELQKDEHVSVESIDPALLQLPLPGTDSGGAATSLIHYLRQSVCPRVALERMVREGML